MTTVSIDHIGLDEKGVARIGETRMKVIHLVMDKMANNSTPEEMALAFPPLTLAQIHAAFAYYYDHKAALDEQISESYARSGALRAESTSQPTRAELVDRLRRKNEGQ